MVDTDTWYACAYHFSFLFVLLILFYFPVLNQLVNLIYLYILT